MSPTHTAELVAAGAIAAAAAVLADAVLRPQSQLFGRTLIAGHDPAEIALTYDDGPNDAATPELLEVLARHGARASFFMIGGFVRQRPEIARAVHAAGHLVGNHTMTHPWLAWQAERVIREEMRGCNEALEDVLGAPARYIRPPHGARRPAVLRIARELGLTVVQWNVWGQDWKPIGARGILGNVEKGMRRARQRGRGANVLLHDGYDRAMSADRAGTVRATDMLLKGLAATQHRLVTVDAWG
ncbi:MAG TPA: polysaccharide deacetylase family protein [Acidobacteriaceae bacterium]|jgi:peptidoglycan/xylan/chitin deacetylase (PgdA/CDA1 family)|nr:polysaccharide deacetylase family protein [Acidobacteriaceae bacterium]